MKLLHLFRVSPLLVLLMSATLYSGIAAADLRVLVTFDTMDHRVQKVVQLEAENQATAAIAASRNQVEEKHGNVVVQWFSVDGVVLLDTTMEDPRVMHAPLTGSEPNPTKVVLPDGAYLLTGPAESAMLEVRLPANNVLGLAAQIWQFELNL